MQRQTLTGFEINPYARDYQFEKWLHNLGMADCVDRNLACRLEKISPGNSALLPLVKD
jgi:hypothetical protein